MTPRPLHLVLLGHGKTGSLVAEVAAERGHRTTDLTEVENPDGAWLTAENLRDADAVIDFTTPDAVLANIAGCVAAKKPMVVGTTGWYGELDRVRQEVERAGIGLCVRRELLVRREPVLPDCPRGGSGAAARICRAHHRAAPHSQERRAVGNGDGVAASGGRGVRRAGRNHVGARRRCDGSSHAGTRRPAAIESS